MLHHVTLQNVAERHRQIKRQKKLRTSPALGELERWGDGTGLDSRADNVGRHTHNADAATKGLLDGKRT
jgi:hypothetical protein